MRWFSAQYQSWGQAVVACNLRQVVFCQTKDSAGHREPWGGGAPASLYSLCWALLEKSSAAAFWLTWTQFVKEPLGASLLMRHNKNNLLSLRIYPEVLHVRAPPAPQQPHLRLYSTFPPRSWLGVRCEFFFLLLFFLNSCSLWAGWTVMWATGVTSIKTETKSDNPSETHC